MYPPYNIDLQTQHNEVHQFYEIYQILKISYSNYNYRFLSSFNIFWTESVSFINVHVFWMVVAFLHDTSRHNSIVF